jgi:hypothetical protein
MAAEAGAQRPECGGLFTPGKTVKCRGKSHDITYLHMLVCRKACVAAEQMNIGTGRADK